MKANELMIGDWVYIEHTEDGVAPYKELTQWTKEDFGFSDTFIETHIYPVPLTPEILEKNGFERTSDGWECNESDVLTIAIHDGDSCDIWFAEAPFDLKHLTYVLPFTRSVHELQHALRLCKVEKEIEL